MSRTESAGTIGPGSAQRQAPAVTQTNPSPAQATPRLQPLGGIDLRATDNGVSGVLRERRASRQRLAVAADAERERIERDIHDGVQQQLTALQIRLGMAADRHHAQSEDEVSAELYGFGRDLEQAMESLRELAHGVYPPLLAAGGLAAALSSAARHAARPVTVSCRVGRCSPEMERAVYFVCTEAMQNAAKHAGPADVAVRVWDNADTLRFSIRDTGSGFDAASAPAGAGIANMCDRVGALGGTLVIETAPSRGTEVTGELPYA